MTSTTSTALVALIEKGKIALRQGKSLKDVAIEIADPAPEHVVTAVAVPFPPVPAPLTITPEDKRALLDLPKVFGKVVVGERRTLAEDEITALRAEQEVLRQIENLMKGRDDAIKEYVRNHMDVDAEERGQAVPKDVVRGGKVIVEATPRDGSGHYILASKGNPVRVPIPGTNTEYSSEYRAGTVGINGSALDALLESGEITREDYLAMTVERRVFDEDKAKKALLAKPERLSILRKITTRSAAGTSLFVRKAK
jgi:hypothetical protein